MISQQAAVVNVLDPLLGDADDKGPAARLDPHQPFALKLRDRFANGEAADAKALRQRRLLEVDTRLQVPQDDSPAQRLRDPLPERLWRCNVNTQCVDHVPPLVRRAGHVILPAASRARFPPSTANRCPVTKAEASEARKIAGPTRSSGSPNRPNGRPVSRCRTQALKSQS